MLLVDDDEAEIGERQKERRARADDDPRLAARSGAPDALPRALGEARMPLSRPRPEAGGEAVEELRGQRDFRQQHKGLAALP